MFLEEAFLALAVLTDVQYFSPGMNRPGLRDSVYDLSGVTNPELSFDTDYQSYFVQSADIEATSDGGAPVTFRGFPDIVQRDS